MAKWANDIIMDTGLQVIKTGITSYGPCNKMVACSAQPTNYTEANATYALADAAMSGSDFTLANGDGSGRKLTVGAKASQLIDASGTATHVALVDTANSVLLYVTTCSSQALTANGSNTVSFPAWDVEISDPS